MSERHLVEDPLKHLTCKQEGDWDKGSASSTIQKAEALEKNCEKTLFAVQALLLSGAETSVIASLIGLDPQVVQAYLDFFFNVENHSLPQKRTVIEQISESQQQTEILNMCAEYGDAFALWYLFGEEIEDDVLMDKMKSVITKKFFDIDRGLSDDKNVKKLLDIFNSISADKNGDIANESMSQLVQKLENTFNEQRGTDTIEEIGSVSLEDLQQNYIGVAGENKDDQRKD